MNGIDKSKKKVVIWERAIFFFHIKEQFICALEQENNQQIPILNAKLI